MIVSARRSRPSPVSLLLSVWFLAAALGASDVGAQALLTEVLDDLDGRVLTVTRLEYAPGQAAGPHRHPAYLAAYVLSGHVESARDEEAPVLYGPGDVWYESPMQLHRVFRNPSTTEPVVVILFGLRDPGAPGAIPEPNDGGR